MLRSFHKKLVIHWFPDMGMVSLSFSSNSLSYVVIMLTSSLATVPYNSLSQILWIILSVVNFKVSLFNIQFSDFLFSPDKTQPNIVCNVTVSLFLDLVSSYKWRVGWFAPMSSSLFSVATGSREMSRGVTEVKKRYFVNETF